MMFSRREYHSWCGYLYVLVMLGLLESVVTVFNSSKTSHNSLLLSTQSANVTTTFTQAVSTPNLSTPNITSTTLANHGIQTTIRPSSTEVVTPSISSIMTTPPVKKNTTNKLSSFGIVMLSLGGILIVAMIVSLLVICCRGRERGPGGAHVPHSNVKMKPWKSSELSTANELTEDTADVLNQSNHSQGHHNSGLTSSPKSGPALSLTPATNNNLISTPTGSFSRNLQTHSPGGDLGEFGRKLSLGRQAYEQNETPEEKTAECEPAKEAKREQDDMTTVHYV